MKDRRKGAVVGVIVIAALVVGVYLILSGGGAGSGGGGEWNPYQFKEDEYYKYSGFIDSQSGTFSWEVISVSGDQITVDISWTLDGEDNSITVSGDKENIYNQVFEESHVMGPLLSMSLYGDWIEILLTKTGLSVGSSWSVSLPDGEEYTVKIVGTKTYGGKRSYVGEARLGDNLIYKAAIAKDLGFPTYVAAYDSTTEEPNLEITLEEYSS